MASRDNWKGKYMDLKSSHNDLKKDYAKLSAPDISPGNLSPKPKHHSYSIQVIMLCIWIRQQGNCSLRSCAAILKVVSLMLGLESSFPSRGNQNTQQNATHNIRHFPLQSPALFY